MYLTFTKNITSEDTWTMKNSEAEWYYKPGDILYLYKLSWL